MRFLFAEAHQDDVCSEAMKPRREGGFASECMDFTEELEEGFLSEVFGFEWITDHAEAEAVNAAGVLTVERFEGGAVAMLGAEDHRVELGRGRLDRLRKVRIWKSFHLVSLGAMGVSCFNYDIVARRA